jgi:uncharacterized protein YdeI (BOF family)
LKKFLVILLLVLVMASVVAAAGCGDSDSGETGQEETTVTGPLGEDAEGEEAGADYSVVGSYESAEGTNITLDADGTFETDAWGGTKDGTYMYIDEATGKWVDLSFDDGTSVRLSVMIGMDEVAAIADGETLIQYTKK